MRNCKTDLISPYRDTLVNLLDNTEELPSLFQRSYQLPKIQLSYRNICDFELLASGAFSPLRTFAGKDDYQSILETMRLSNGTLFPIPITLNVRSIDEVKLDSECALIDQFNNVLGIIRIEEIYEPDIEKEAVLVCGTNSLKHPMVAEMRSWGKYNLSGKLTVLSLPKHYDFEEHRLTSKDVRNKLGALGNKNVVAFQTRNPLHRAHEEMTKRAVTQTDGTLLLHPVVGMTQPNDIEYFTRVRSYQELVKNYYEPSKIVLALLPLAMRMAGPREALWHAIIRRNYGANHLIVGRDHAGPRSDSEDGGFYEPYAAQELLLKYEEETGVKPVVFSEFVYLNDEGRFEEIENIPKAAKYSRLSGSDIKNRLASGGEIPEWYLRDEITTILKESFPPKNRKGFCVWLTGLSGAGKSTIANILTTQLLAHGRNVTLLDGDNVRANLSKGLGFSKEDRDTNVRRIGFVAAEIVKHNGVAICAAISPFDSVRNECRSIIGESQFIEVFVDTPLEVCERRDTKGLYSAARKGNLVNFTGINDPYEIPADPDIQVETVTISPKESAEMILEVIRKLGFI